VKRRNTPNARKKVFAWCREHAIGEPLSHQFDRNPCLGPQPHRQLQFKGMSLANALSRTDKAVRQMTGPWPGHL
jgi:hypothetical protein